MSTRIKKSDLARDALYEKVNTIADELDNSKVSKTGDTMNGTLTNNGVFVSQLDSINYIARSKSLVKGTTPTDSNKYVGYDWQDKNGQRLAYLGVVYGMSGSKRLELQKLDGNLSEFNISYPIRNSCNFYFLDTQHTLGNVTVNTWSDNEIQFQDSKRTRLARIQPMLAADGTAQLHLAASKGLESESSLVIGSNGYTQCPKPADNSNTNAIATTNWAGGLNRENNWNGLNKFKKSPETHINGNARYKSVCTGYTKGTAPTTNQSGGISITDKNGVEVATLYSSIDTNNAITSALWVKQPTATGTEAKALSIWCDKNGVFHTLCSVQSGEPNSIVTTASRGAGIIRFGNGLQICWGTSPVNQTITLPQPFINNTYRVAFCQTDGGEHHINQVVADKTTTSFRFSRGYTGEWIAIGWWY